MIGFLNRGRSLSFFFAHTERAKHLLMITIRVVWESPQASVVIKPAGIATQAPAGLPSLEFALRGQWFGEEAVARTSDPATYLALPHRLDRPVSGLLLVARTKRAARLLGQQFESRKVAKRYLAWVEGIYRPDKDVTAADPSGTVWHDRLRKLEGLPRAEIVADPANSQEAITTVRVLGYAADRTLIELSPETGRMHQLRVQSAHRGHPIIGDIRYGARQDPAWDEAIEPDRYPDRHLGGEAIALHAWRLGFHDPISGKWTEVRQLPHWQRFDVGPLIPNDPADPAA
jgi:tRNA pseudouridine32 synthase/23S rRNA pseudouridine746 synthase/23S rRNA pseudouridine1911/1915/1917 synthase